MTTKKKLVTALIEEAIADLLISHEEPGSDIVNAYASECAENILNEIEAWGLPGEIGRGSLHTATFANGKQWRSHNCDDCECDCHDETPLPPGVHVTVQLDGNPRIGLSRVVLIEEAEEEVQ